MARADDLHKPRGDCSAKTHWLRILLLEQSVCFWPWCFAVIVKSDTKAVQDEDMDWNPSVQPYPFAITSPAATVTWVYLTAVRARGWLQRVLGLWVRWFINRLDRKCNREVPIGLHNGGQQKQHLASLRSGGLEMEWSGNIVLRFKQRIKYDFFDRLSQIIQALESFQAVTTFLYSHRHILTLLWLYPHNPIISFTPIWQRKVEVHYFNFLG